MSIYFTLEYDENGVSKIVEKKDTSTRAITQRDFNFGSYVGNQITSPEDPNQPGEGDNTGDFISQMGTGTMGGNEMTDYERFIDRSNLTAFMNEGKGPKDTKFVNAFFAALGIPVTAEGLTKFFDGIQKFLPKESPEVKAIRRFYATEGLKYMNPNSPDYIPGMENYNIVYGGFPGIKDPSIGLQDALTRRSDNIIDTLKSKYGFNDIEIKQIQMGTYNGTKGYNEIMGKQTNLIDLLTNITQFKKIEKDYIDNIPTDEVAGTGGVDQIDVTAPGAGTVITPDTDEEAGRPGNFDPGGGFVDQGGYGEFGPPPKNDDKPKDDNKGKGGSGGFGGADFGSGTGEYGGL